MPDSAPGPGPQHTRSDPLDARVDGRLLRGEATRRKVFDAAERLFADSGYDGVSIRRIAQEAGVTLGVVGFHGGSKVELFKTILERRVVVLSEKRRVALMELMARTASQPDLHGIMRAYIEPYLEQASCGDPQWRAYARLIALLVSDERWYSTIGVLYDPTAREFMAAIRSARPDFEPARLAASFVMAVASMLSVVASTVRIDALADYPRPRPILDHCETLVQFCCGGIEAAAERPVENVKRKKRGSRSAAGRHSER